MTRTLVPTVALVAVAALLAPSSASAAPAPTLPMYVYQHSTGAVTAVTGASFTAPAVSTAAPVAPTVAAASTLVIKMHHYNICDGIPAGTCTRAQADHAKDILHWQKVSL